MPSIRIIKDQKDQLYFITFSVKNLYYIFDRHGRFEILENAFVYCQKHKGLKIYAFVFMLNHLHFIGQAPDMIVVVNSLKSYLSHELQKNIIATEPEVINLFKEKDSYHFWQDNNYPELITSEDFLEQKFNYIHYNPVRKEYVYHPEDWRWSSASKIPTKIAISNF
ncbi:MAG TPA: transposase [Patescibacteria group bacterium]|nr:transposase [Patescibacteria group bacterium]